MSRIAVWPELKSIADSLACFYETKYTGTNMCFFYKPFKKFRK